MPEPRLQFYREDGLRKFPWEARLRPLCESILRKEKAKGAVNVVLGSDAMVRDLNHTYRKLDKVTDVLSFEWHQAGLLGEIYIAEDQVKRQAPMYGVSYYKELKRVLVHGILHLCGHDHMNAKARKQMRTIEEQWLGHSPYVVKEN